MNKVLSFCLFFIFSGVLLSESLATDEKVRRSVYLDPLFGGKESGPVVDQTYQAKVFTLDTAQKLKVSLEVKGIVTYLSRDSDSSIPLEERVTEGKIKRSDVYIAIGLSKASRDCISIYYTKQEQATTQNEKGLDAILKKLKKTYITEGSIKLAETVMRNIKKISVPVCIEIQSKNDYILNKAYCPTAIINFGVSNSPSPYILDSYIMNKIIDAVSVAITEHLEFYTVSR
ncbi:MAG: N-acetylmuramoyl-L-alanine amidase [Nitrospinota bacterium]